MAKLRWPGVTLVVLLAAGLLVPASAAVRLGTISIGAGYGYASGPYWGGYYPAPFYGGWWGNPWAYPFYDPFYSPFYGPVYYSPQADKGEVKLQSSAGNAEVYIDSAYAGTASKLKTFWLSPGAYDLEVRAQGREPRQRRIYVLTGKTLKVNME